MIDDWFSVIELPLSWRQFHQLPQNPAYKYEYFDGRAWLSPRPKSGRAVLDLAAFSRPIAEVVCQHPLSVRRLEDCDWPQLAGLFSAAFMRVQPFASLSDEDRKKAAEDCLNHTRQGGDGPLLESACFVAADTDNHPRGAILITNRAGEGRTGSGLPHVTWIFVSPWCVRSGAGMALLDAAAYELLRLGFAELLSTFLVGNESSMLWHWRAGFKLLEQPWSIRAARADARREKSARLDTSDRS